MWFDVYQFKKIKYEPNTHASHNVKEGKGVGTAGCNISWNRVCLGEVPGRFIEESDNFHWKT